MTIEAFIKQHFTDFYNTELALPFQIEEKTLDKNFVVTPYSQVENKIFFLTKGLVQISTLKDDEEKILEFTFPGDFFCAYTSFLLQQPSDVKVSPSQNVKPVSCLPCAQFVRRDVIQVTHNS